MRTARSLISVLFLLAAGQSLPAASSDWGVLLLAHGGQAKWNRAVERAVRAAKLTEPTEIFFGMAAAPEEREALAAAILKLKKRGVRRIVAVPFLVSSHSEVYRQYQYMLGLAASPGFPEAMMHGMGGHHAMMPAGPLTPVRFPDTPIFLTQALDDSPEVAEVLADRARALSRNPGKEGVVLAAHGPNDEADNVLWKKMLDGLAERLRAEGAFADVAAVTLRDDADKPVRDAATAQLRERVTAIAARGERALVVPVLISSGGIERGLAKRLDGLDCRLGEPMLDHPALSRWIARKVREAAR